MALRTAEEIFNGYKRLIDSDISSYWCTEKDFISAIKEARRDIIMELIKYMDDHSMSQTGTYKKALSLLKENK